MLGRTAGFVHGTIPVIDLTTGVVFDSKGIRGLKASMDVFNFELWESMGPIFATIPQLDN